MSSHFLPHCLYACSPSDSGSPQIHVLESPVGSIVHLTFCNTHTRISITFW